jgi:serine protease inhibitor
MSERFKKDMDKIKLDDKLKNKTIKLMENAMEQRKKPSKRFFFRRNFLIPAVSFMLIVALIFGITSFNEPFVINVQAQDLMEGIQGEKVDTTTDFSKEFLDSTSDFSMEMFKKLATKENAVYSPVSLYLALGLVLNGAEGETKNEILNVLAKYGVTSDELNLYYKSLIEELTQNNKDTKLTISNSIWYDDIFDVNQDFLRTNKTYFDAYAYKKDFGASDTPEIINNWVKQVTKDKIDKMVEEIDPNVVMMLFSSIYFDAKWEKPFSKERTSQGEFNVNDKLKVNADFMYKKDNMKAFENDKEQAVMLPYNDGRFAFMAILPNENTDVREYIKTLNKESIAQRMISLQTADVTLVLPKFEIEFGKSIKDELKALGIVEAFDDYKANLAGMGSASGNLYLSEVAQKTYIRVDEEGTQAASVVKVEVSDKSLGMFISFNRPFVYTIIDTTTNLPIFMGILDNPSK